MSEDDPHIYSPRTSMSKKDQSRVSLSPKTTTTATYFIRNLPTSFTREELIRLIVEKGTRLSSIEHLIIHNHTVAGEERIFAEIDVAEPVPIDPDEEEGSFYAAMNGEDFKNSTLQVVPGGDLQSRVLLIGVSALAREGEVFYFLKQVTRALRRITLFDDPVHQALNGRVCLVDFDNFQAARAAKSKLSELLQSESPFRRVLGPDCQALVAEPYFDYFAALSRRTNIVLVKNLPAHPNIPLLYEIFARFGKVTRIRSYVHRAYVFFADSTHAYMLLSTVDQMLIQGSLCKLRPARSHMREPVLSRYVKPSVSLSASNVPVSSNASGPYSGTLLVPPTTAFQTNEGANPDSLAHWQQLSAAELSVDDQTNLIQYFSPREMVSAIESSTQQSEQVQLAKSVLIKATEKVVAAQKREQELKQEIEMRQQAVVKTLNETEKKKEAQASRNRNRRPHYQERASHSSENSHRGKQYQYHRPQMPPEEDPDFAYMPMAGQMLGQRQMPQREYMEVRKREHYQPMYGEQIQQPPPQLHQQQQSALLFQLLLEGNPEFKNRLQSLIAGHHQHPEMMHMQHSPAAPPTPMGMGLGMMDLRGQVPQQLMQARLMEQRGSSAGPISQNQNYPPYMMEQQQPGPTPASQPPYSLYENRQPPHDGNPHHRV